ncbi:MAG: hypothetical protein AB8H80_10735 [Planctomycetota bacterium]
MPQTCKLTLSCIVAGLAATGFASAQASPVDELLKLLPAARGQSDDAEPVKKLDAALARLTDATTKLTSPEYRQASQFLMHSKMPTRAGRVVRRGLELFGDNTELLEMLGTAEFATCQTARTDVAMRAHARNAIDAFERARKAGSTSPTCRLMPWQAHIIDCRFDRALAEIDRLIADKDLQKMMPDRHLARGMALLGAGPYEDALAELTHDAMPMQMRMSTESMAARAEALAGQPAAAVRRSKALFERRKDATSLGVYADTLAYAGLAEEALKVLRDNPIQAIRGEPAVRVAQRKQSRATFEYLISLRGERPDNLRTELAKRLGHSVSAHSKALTTATSPQSPLLLGYAARNAPSSPKGWGNDLLVLACIAAGDSYKPSDDEQKLIDTVLDDSSKMALQGQSAKARALTILRAACMRDDYEGSLVALQIGLQL